MAQVASVRNVAGNYGPHAAANGCTRYQKACAVIGICNLPYVFLP